MARIKKSCNILLSFYQRPIEYIEFLTETYSDPANTARLLDIVNQTLGSLDTNIKVDIEGVTFEENGAGILLNGFDWLAIEPYDSYDVLAAENWMNSVTIDAQKANPTWTIMPSRTGRGYFGLKMTKNF